MTLEEKFKHETGQDARCITTDGIHAVGIEVYRFDYVAWLEEKASRESRQLSAVPSEELNDAAREYYDNDISADRDRPEKLDYDDIITAFCHGAEWIKQRGIAR